MELWILVRQYICLHIAECRLRFALDAVVKGLDDVFFKVLGVRIRGDDRFAISAPGNRIERRTRRSNRRNALLRREPR